MVEYAPAVMLLGLIVALACFAVVPPWRPK